MKIKLIGLLCVLVVVLLAPTFVQAQFDLGEPDTMIIMTSRPTVGSDADPKNTDSTFIVELWVYNDGNGIAPQFGFRWESDVLTLDSGMASPEALATFDMNLYYDTDLATSNANNRAAYAGISFFGKWFPTSATRHLLATYYFTISDWTVLSEIVVDSNGYDGGAEMIFVSSDGDYVPVYAHGDVDISVKDPSDVNTANGLPATYSLGQNYPNPFNPTTTVEFSLAQAGEFTFTVYNVIGQVVYEETKLGHIGDNTVPWNASNQSSGVYFYKLQSGDFSETKKMMLVK